MTKRKPGATASASLAGEHYSGSGGPAGSRFPLWIQEAVLRDVLGLSAEEVEKLSDANVERVYAELGSLLYIGQQDRK